MAAYLAKLDAALHDKNCPCTQYIEMIEKKTNVPRKFLVLGKIWNDLFAFSCHAFHSFYNYGLIFLQYLIYYTI